MPTIRAIVEAQRDLIATLPNIEPEGDPARTCWACGMKFDGGGWPDRAHIVARSQDGSFEPSNFFLLCKPCHKEQPDGATRSAQIEWLRGHPDFMTGHLDRYRTEYEALHDALTLAGERTVSAWLTEIGEEGVKRMFETGASKSAGQSLRQEMSNGAWHVISEFKGWASNHPSPEQTPCHEIAAPFAIIPGERAA